MYKTENLDLLERVEALQAEVQILRDSLDVFTNKSKAEIELEVMRKEIEVLEGKLQMAA